MKDARHLLRLPAFLAAFGGAAGAAAGIRSELLTEILRRTPAPMRVAEGREIAAMEKHEAALPRAWCLGLGQSREPVYAPNTAIVVQAIDDAGLKKGTTVEFVSRHARAPIRG